MWTNARVIHTLWRWDVKALTCSSKMHFGRNHLHVNMDSINNLPSSRKKARWRTGTWPWFAWRWYCELMWVQILLRSDATSDPAHLATITQSPLDCFKSWLGAPWISFRRETECEIANVVAILMSISMPTVWNSRFRWLLQKICRPVPSTKSSRKHVQDTYCRFPPVSQRHNVWLIIKFIRSIHQKMVRNVSQKVQIITIWQTFHRIPVYQNAFVATNVRWNFQVVMWVSSKTKSLRKVLITNQIESIFKKELVVNWYQEWSSIDRPDATLGTQYLMIW